MKRLVLDAVETAAPKTNGKARTVLPVDDITTKLLEQFAEVNPRFRQLKGQNETLSKQCAGGIKAAFWNEFSGRGVPDETLVVIAGGREIKMIVKNSYSTQCAKEEAIVGAIGQKNTDKYFQFVTKLGVNLSELPEEVQAKFAPKLIELAQKMGAMAAIKKTECIQPKPGFHEARTTVLTKEQNIALDGVLPITAYPLL